MICKAPRVSHRLPSCGPPHKRRKNAISTTNCQHNLPSKLKPNFFKNPWKFLVEPRGIDLVMICIYFLMAGKAPRVSQRLPSCGGPHKRRKMQFRQHTHIINSNQSWSQVASKILGNFWSTPEASILLWFSLTFLWCSLPWSFLVLSGLGCLAVILSCLSFSDFFLILTYDEKTQE